MALIKCPECGKEFSDKAQACPNCGCPIEEIKTIDIVSEASYQKIPDTPPKKKSNFIMPVISILIGVAVIFCIFFMYNGSKEASKESLVSDIQGQWYMPYDEIACKMDISSTGMVISAEAVFDSSNKQTEEFDYDIEFKDENTIMLSDDDDNSKEYTVTFNESKSQMTVSPGIVGSENDEVWYYGEPRIISDGVINPDMEECFVDKETGMMVYIDSVNPSAKELQVIGFVLNPTRSACNRLELEIELFDENDKTLEVGIPVVINENGPLKSGDNIRFSTTSPLENEDTFEKTDSYYLDFHKITMEDAA